MCHRLREVARSRRSTLQRHAVAISMLAAASVGAQLPGSPVVQNPWGTPVIVVALDVAGGSDRGVVAAAGSWAPLTKLQLNGGLGIQSGRAVGASAAYGVRLAVPFAAATSTMGFAMFAGIGGCESHHREFQLPVLDSITNSTEIAVGLSFGWQHAMASTHGIALYMTPAIAFFQGGSEPGELVRVGIGADVAISESWGISLVTDVGRERPRGGGGPTGPQFGLAVSYVINRR